MIKGGKWKNISLSMFLMFDENTIYGLKDIWVFQDFIPFQKIYDSLLERNLKWQSSESCPGILDPMDPVVPGFRPGSTGGAALPWIAIGWGLV